MVQNRTQTQRDALCLITDAIPATATAAASSASASASTTASLSRWQRQFAFEVAVAHDPPVWARDAPSIYVLPLPSDPVEPWRRAFGMHINPPSSAVAIGSAIELNASTVVPHWTYDADSDRWSKVCC